METNKLLFGQFVIICLLAVQTGVIITAINSKFAEPVPPQLAPNTHIICHLPQGSDRWVCDDH
jgi:hypothetical protein